MKAELERESTRNADYVIRSIWPIGTDEVQSLDWLTKALFDQADVEQHLPPKSGTVSGPDPLAR